MVSRYRGECASPLHLRDRDLTCTKLKLSRTFRSSSSIPDFKSHFGGTDRTHSLRSATIGSTFVARRAGIQHASKATVTSNSAIRPNVAGSVGVTPKSKVDINRVSAMAATRPAATPISVKSIPCPIINRSTSRRPAPSAIRRSEEHTSELQSLRHLVCRLLLEKKKK